MTFCDALSNIKEIPFTSIVSSYHLKSQNIRPSVWLDIIELSRKVFLFYLADQTL